VARDVLAPYSEDGAASVATDNTFLSSAFSSATASSKALAILPAIGRAAALEFRLAEELLPDERNNQGHMEIAIARERRLVPPIGDRIVAEPLTDVLDVIHRHSHVVSWFKSSYPKRDSPPRTAYGYSEDAFSENRMRPAERTLVCVAADVCFAPYAAGFWDATKPMDLRIDLRSAATLVWTWGTFDHRPLAYALSAARYEPNAGEWMPFEPFTKLYQKVIELHWMDDARCQRVARYLSALTTERLQYVRPGRSAKSHLYSPLIAALRDHDDPRVRADVAGNDVDPIAEQARAAGLILRKLHAGSLDPDLARRSIEAFAAAVSDVIEGRSRA